ncbi:two-component system response regulator (stage 0 sporulation protein F) [Paenibacillus anaericanus]|uniref:Response regulator n=1 Tax=Paenibacillus anaericanus TaxID=170367 RepID=A0A433YC63_9BACL|nr:response regulator [Paenibacillus anaericanus]MDQ0088734.1 two-component system response regulator (stage 0 sporulation protein F) [Paenibacillus anaericanus]RUT47471.1 response regulator [Paenibacillus anaericanus]
MLVLKKKLLIVDDQYAIRKLLEEMFRSEDYETFEACNGEQALQLLDQEAPDLVLLDMKMPGLSGLELIDMIGQRERKTIVVVITAYKELELVQRTNQFEPTMEFAKPFDIYEVKDAVRDLLHMDAVVI